MPVTDWGWEITPEELERWTITRTDDVIALNKPAGVVCHPSKRGPWSSVAGACREGFGLERIHMPYRLDRETSGVLILATNAASATRLQKAIQERQARKTYLAIVDGLLDARVTVDQPIGRDTESAFYTRRRVGGEAAQAAVTEFAPVAYGLGRTLVMAHPHTGRMHQIRVHASWLGFPLVGDKLYGPDPDLMLAFMEEGFSPRLQALLPLERHALHASNVTFDESAGGEEFSAPLAHDLVAFCRDEMGIEPPV